MADIIQGHRAEIIEKDGKFYGQTGKTWLEIDTVTEVAGVYATVDSPVFTGGTAVSVAAIDLATTTALVNELRAILIANGIATVQ